VHANEYHDFIICNRWKTCSQGSSTKGSSTKEAWLGFLEHLITFFLFYLE